TNIRAYICRQLNPLIVGNLLDRQREPAHKRADIQWLLFNLNSARFKFHQVEQIVNQLEQAHPMRLHRPKHFLCDRRKCVSALDNDAFERSEQKGQRSAEFMADISKKTAFDLIEFLQFLVVFFQLLLVFVEFVEQRILTETKPEMITTAR